MNQIVEGWSDDDDSYGSMSSCLSSKFSNNDIPTNTTSFDDVLHHRPLKRSISFDVLHHRPLRLAVLKLDGSSFEIEVPNTGTVGEVKKAVESAFRHLPKTGPNRVSWEHLWGQFCLCHESQKLLTDSDYLSLINVKDGDQLQFVHHASTTYNLLKLRAKREDADSDTEQPTFGQDDHASPDYVSRRQCRLTKFFNYLLSHRNYSNTHKHMFSRR